LSVKFVRNGAKAVAHANWSWRYTFLLIAE
jgi:hypothetical protein